MIYIDVKIAGQELHADAPPLAAGSAGKVACKVTYDQEWEDLTIALYFDSVDDLGVHIVRSRLVTDLEKVLVPPEVLREGYLYISASGSGADGVQLPTAVMSEPLRIRKAGATEADEDSPATPSQTAQILAAIGSIPLLKTSTKTSLVAAINELYDLRAAVDISASFEEAIAAGSTWTDFIASFATEGYFALASQGRAARMRVMSFDGDLVKVVTETFSGDTTITTYTRPAESSVWSVRRVLDSKSTLSSFLYKDVSAAYASSSATNPGVYAQTLGTGLYYVADTSNGDVIRVHYIDVWAVDGSTYALHRYIDTEFWSVELLSGETVLLQYDSGAVMLSGALNFKDASAGIKARGAGQLAVVDAENALAKLAVGSPGADTDAVPRGYADTRYLKKDTYTKPPHIVLNLSYDGDTWGLTSVTKNGETIDFSTTSGYDYSIIVDEISEAIPLGGNVELHFGNAYYLPQIQRQEGNVILTYYDVGGGNPQDDGYTIYRVAISTNVEVGVWEL